ncbi:TPA: HAD-IA family hydrolase [Vibrio alginolyticus]
MLDEYNTVSFDCYGTLIDWESAIINFFRNDTQTKIIDEEIIDLFLSSEMSVIAAAPTLNYQDVLEETYKKMTLSTVQTFNSNIAKEFAASITTWEPFYDTRKFLKNLKAEGYNLVILSNIDRKSLDKTMEYLGVEFLDSYTAEEIGDYKPSPKCFSYMLLQLYDKYGIKNSDILHFSVSLHHDHRTAISLGIDTCWINRAQTVNGTLSTPDNFVNDIKPTYAFLSLEEAYKKLRRNENSQLANS